MRFEPEISDDANAGLHIVRDMLHKVQKAHPEISSCLFFWLCIFGSLHIRGLYRYRERRLFLILKKYFSLYNSEFTS